DEITAAGGESTPLSGKLLDARGEPVKNAVVEIWQVDNNGAYLHTQSDNRVRRDANFQGFGRFLTGSSGEYYFRTIKPVAYPGRTPHIHYKVKVRGQQEFTTQLYIKGETRNANDGLYQRLRDARSRDALTVDFAPLRGSTVGELTAHFDIILGFTPAG